MVLDMLSYHVCGNVSLEYLSFSTASICFLFHFVRPKVTLRNRAYNSWNSSEFIRKTSWCRKKYVNQRLSKARFKSFPMWYPMFLMNSATTLVPLPPMPVITKGGLEIGIVGKYRFWSNMWWNRIYVKIILQKESLLIILLKKSETWASLCDLSLLFDFLPV